MRQVLKHGFSLIEINLAIFVVAMGMLTLFSLFPRGLQQIESAADDTQEAFFADYVHNTLRSNAAWISSTNWLDIDPFTVDIMQFDLSEIEVGGGSIKTILFTDPEPGLEADMRYILEISTSGNNTRIAKLWCRAGQYGTQDVDVFKPNAALFITKFFYSGMP